MPVNREVKIIKIPLSDRERMPDYPKAFPKLPRLYLELLENKAKIKQDLINKEYIYRDNQSSEKQIEHREPEQEIKENRYTESKYDTTTARKQDDSDDEYAPRRKDSHRDSRRKDRRRNDVDSDRDSDVDSNKEVRRRQPDEFQDSLRSSSRSESSSSENIRKRSNDTTESDALSERLKQLLGDDDTKSEKEKTLHHSPKQSAGSKYTPYETYKQQRQETGVPPTLAELEAKGHYQGKAELRNINYVGANEYEEEDAKRELIFKFDLLKKSYPLAAPTIPEYTVHSDLREMQKAYDTSVRRLSLDSTVESYKTYLIGGFMGVEFIFGNFLGFDMQGFTQQQIVSMHSYEKLLIELGEKSYVPSGSKWPVELRLLFLIIMNAGFFIVSKMIMRKTGANLLNMVNSMNVSNSQPASSSRPKRRMKGPNINLDDIPEADETSSQNQV